MKDLGVSGFGDMGIWVFDAWLKFCDYLCQCRSDEGDIGECSDLATPSYSANVGIA